MARIQTYNFKPAIHGDTWEGIQVVLNVNGAPKDITGAVVKMSLSKSPDSTPVKTFSTLSSDITISNGPGGTISFVPVIMDVEPGVYSYDMQYTFLDGSVKTYMKGTFTVINDITQ